MTWALLLPVFVCFGLGAFVSYNKTARDSDYYLPIMILCSLANACLWVIATRRLDNTDKIVLFSLLCDALMILAYYGGPVLICQHRMPVQAWIAGAVVIAGMFWFKVATE